MAKEDDVNIKYWLELGIVLLCSLEDVRRYYCIALEVSFSKETSAIQPKICEIILY